MLSYDSGRTMAHESPTTRNVSIRDVAEHAGVSLGSASRVINGVANVRPAVRERVLAAIEALGYRPNHAAQSLRRQSTKTIGCLLTDVTHPLYGQLFHSLEERFRKAGYVTLLANSLNNADREVEILQTFGSRGLDGVIAAPGNERIPAVTEALRALGRPAVVLDRDMAADLDRVQFDHVPGMRKVVARLAALGHRRIALILTQSVNRPMLRRIDAFRAGLAAADIAPEEATVLRLPTAMSPAYGEVSQMLARRPRPTAVIALGTSILLETLNAVAARRWRIPQDISVVSIGDPAFACNYSPPLSALRVDLDRVAAQASDMLLSRLNGGVDLAPRTVKVAAEFIERGSCGPAPV